MENNRTKQTTNKFAANDQENYYSEITSIKVNGKNAYELKGKFFDDLHNNAFSGTNGEDAVEHIKYFLRIVDPIDLPNVNQDKHRVLVFPILLVGDAWKWFDEIKGSINSWVDLTAKFFGKYYPPSCTSGITTTIIKWDPTNPMFEYCDDTELTNGKGSDLEEECLRDVNETAEIFKIEDVLLDYETPLWDATLRVMKFHEWLKNSFENFHELDYDGLVKLEECWWKVNAHEKSPFARWENYGQGPYANAKTKKDYDPYLDNNCTFEKDYKANNAGDTQDTKKERHDPSICNIRRFEMIKYSFRNDEEYVAIKENEYDDLTNTSKEAIHTYQEIFRMMDEISKKARILELKRRHLKITVLTTNMPYPSRSTRNVPGNFTKDHEGNKINTPSRIAVLEKCEYSWLLSFALVFVDMWLSVVDALLMCVLSCAVAGERVA
ncbi:hypothetical protein Tco_0201050 [Tanacetum coccineum]